MLDILENAIKSRSKLAIDYVPGGRMIEPHTLGFSKEGKPLLRACQVLGASASGKHEDWKLRRVDKVSSIRLTGESFDGPRPGYRRGDSAIKGGIMAGL